MSSESDVEMLSALPKKKTKKQPKSPSNDILKNSQESKKTTKAMLKEALIELNTRKGVSLYAIKKHIIENNNVNAEKINYLIKKALKSEMEIGIIVQTKGVGAAGSFKLAPKKKPEKDGEKKVPSTKTVDTKKETKSKKKESQTDTEGKVKEKIKAIKTKKTDLSEDKSIKTKAKSVKIKENQVEEDKPKQKTQTKKAKVKKTPAKKREAMLKRKSIGSIIKPPKMKPKAR